MSKHDGQIPLGRGPRDDWHEMVKSMTGESLFACGGDASGGLGVKIEKGRTVIRGGLELKAIAWAGGMSLAGVVLLVWGGASLFSSGGASLLSLMLLVAGGGAAGGGCFLFLARRGISMSHDGRELILACGLRRRFHLDAKNLIPRLSLASDSAGDSDSQEAPEVHLKLFNIKLRQAVVLITGGQDHAGAICRSLDEMLGTDSLDSTFTEVKLAGMGDEWVDVEAPSGDDFLDAAADGEAAPGDAPQARAERAGRPMRVGGIIFAGARLHFPERGIAVVKLPLIRRFPLPLGIILAGWIVVMLLLSVAGGSAGLTAETAMLVGEIAFAAVAIGVLLVFWYHGGQITIDRKKKQIVGPRRKKCGFAGQPISTLNVTAVQTCRDTPQDTPKPGARKKDTSSYELNLVMNELPRRVHLIRDTNGDRVRESAESLAKFLGVSHWDCTGDAEAE